MSDIQIDTNPTISSDQLWDFYVRNDICEVGFGRETATRVLDYPQVIIGAFREGDLVGLARACFDGLSASIMEFSLDLTLQGGSTPHDNGSLVEADPLNIGRRIAEILRKELKHMGCSFISSYAADCEADFYLSIGFQEHTGHKALYIDERPYAVNA